MRTSRRQFLGTVATGLGITGVLPRLARSVTKGGTLTVGTLSINPNSDPGLYGLGNWLANDTVLERVVEYDYAKGDFVPKLAQRWEVSPDGRTLTFHLQRGIKFHDGTELTSAAAKRSWDRLLNSSDPTQVKGSYAGSEIGGANVAEVRAVDRYTVQVVLKRADRSEVANLGHFAAGIISDAAITQHGQQVGLHLAGTGPFKLDSLSTSQIELSRFDGYWGEKPNIDRIVIRAYPETATLINALVSGEVLVSSTRDFTSVNRLQQSGLDVYFPPKLVGTSFLDLNLMRSPALKPLKARQAVNFGIDREEIARLIYGGRAQAPAGIQPPVSWAYDESLKAGSAFNPERAKALLKEAGSDPKLTLLTNSAGVNPLMAELLQRQLNAVGFQVSINKVDLGSFYPTLYEGKYDLATDARRYITPDPDNFLSPILYSTSVNASKALALNTYPQAAEWDRMLDEARQAIDRTKARPLYIKIQQWLQEHLPITPLAHFGEPVPISKRVHDLDASAMPLLGFRPGRVWID